MLWGRYQDKQGTDKNRNCRNKQNIPLSQVESLAVSLKGRFMRTTPILGEVDPIMNPDRIWYCNVLYVK